MFVAAVLASPASHAVAASPCDAATHPGQCSWVDAPSLPPFVRDAIVAKGGVVGSGNVLVLTSEDPADADTEISNDVAEAGCGTNPDGWETYDCVLLDSFVPPQDSVVIALSSEWFEWYQTIFTDWMTISGAGVATVDVSINSWIDSKVDVLPYGPMETGAVILTSLSADKMVSFRVADSGDHIYDTAIAVVPASWFSDLNSVDGDPTILCGNGVLEPGEDCDDGNTDTDDDCSSLCLGTQAPPVVPPVTTTCGNLHYVWPTGATAPYTCGADLCNGFRCVIGDTISPACYTAAQCASACSGDCVDVQTAELDCSTMCSVQPPADQPPPPLPATCDTLVYAWPDGTTMPYSCDDGCHGQRCLSGTTIGSECFQGSDCDEACDGVCVDTPADDCTALCAMAELAVTCTEAEAGQTRLAVNQHGACYGNHEVCKNGEWRLDDASWSPDDEACNGIDDDCNGVADDMFVTCGDTGLCQNTVNTCDPADPAVPVACVPLSPPSPVEICNNGLDDDCEGSIDDGCECGDDECMPGEDYAGCPADCPPPADGTACEDGNLCTAGDTWQGGSCVAGEPVSCDSGNACVIDGSCDPAAGCSATKIDCSDSVACTVDSCDATTGCSNTPVDSACDDGDPCTTDACDVVAGCTNVADPGCGGQDADGDGFAPVSAGGQDCDDANAAVFPGAAELCNGIDDDCDAASDEGFGAGAACTSGPNACGEAAAGTFVCSADGLGAACDAVTPPDPAGYGETCTSQPNACGDTAPGTVGCDGSCSASVPPAADTDADGTADCVDGCAQDAGKTEPGICGCGVADVDSNANDIADCVETVRADLAVAVTQLTAVPRAGKRLRYRIDATNLGPDAAATGATVGVSIGGGEAAELLLPKSCTGSAAAITCSTGEMKAGAKRIFRIRFVAASGTTMTVAASIASATLDPNAANQSAVATTTVP